METIQYVGMDDHKEFIEVAVFKQFSRDPEIVKTLKNSKPTIKRFFEQLARNGEIIAGYEAGCMGFQLQRLIESFGHLCILIAPSKTARKPGDKIKTDKRDAIVIAKALRNQDYQPIYIPTKQDEEVREYLRARTDRKLDLTRTKQRVLKFFLRNGYRYPGDRYWTQKHLSWMKTLTFRSELQKETFEHHFTVLIAQEQHVQRMDQRIQEIATSGRYEKQVAQLRCFKGIDYLTALSLIVEIGDFRRFKSAEAFMAFLGLTPSEYSSGNTRRQGAITKAGNTHIRKLLIESSWHYRYTCPPSNRLQQRRNGQSEQIIHYADKALSRLQRKFTKMVYRGKPKQVAVTSVARELAGFIWGLMTTNYA